MEGVGLEPIAIVGMSCHLPGSIRSPSSLWEALKSKRSVRTPKVPASRFNIDGYLHENLERPGSFNVPGGYFLDGTPEDFDPTFFNISPIEAMWLDPQQRRMLEVTYECLESAGLTLDKVAGSNTAVYVGSFTSDFQQMSLKQEDFRHNYAATGVDTGIISARLANVFDLHGPSFTVNTACSSSMYAIHNACLALRARDCTAAIAGGVNLVLTVDQHMNTAKLGVLSPTSTCHTFDVSADGYGRAEGAGALYLKRLADAIRDGDPVRGVIRTSAVNSNGKVAGMGITFPSAFGQESAIRAAYAKSGLDPSLTPYVECHGTGTPVGDPIETRAVARAMNDSRPIDQPLIVGAVKANIGHSEAASGIFAVMKAALMTESGIIPGVSGLKTVNPAIPEEEWNIRVARETDSWPEHSRLRRAGVSSFGYGGTNGHLVVESVDNLYPLYRHGQQREGASYSYSGIAASRPYLMLLSAHDRTTLEQNISAHAAVASKYYLPDLAYTLLSHRTKFPVRGFAVTSPSTIEQDFSLSRFTIGTAPSAPPELGFIFTGQGAQWPRVGATAMDCFPYFLNTIRALDNVLQRLDDHLRPSWSLESVLREPAETSKIGQPEIAQPICTAVQIAIVDLFARWNILPKVTVGHSSGEIAAAYAAGLLSAPEAIITAFLRGYAVSRHAPFGSMLAVGLGAEEAASYISSPDVVVACQNSPRSTTLSGTQEAIASMRERLQAEGIFARELNTGKAYHSPQMVNVANAYDELLDHALARQDSFTWRHPRSAWFSSVTGKEFTGDSIPLTYWSDNLRNRVLFDEAVMALASNSMLSKVKVMVEVGPHSALAGPFKQICQGQGIDRLTYIPTLVRKEDCARKLLSTAGALLLQNYPVNSEQVNSIAEGATAVGMKKSHGPFLLVDLPPYQWSYEKKYWAEARTSKEQRSLTHLRHDLLGSRVYGLSGSTTAWKNTIRIQDVPWIKDHRLGKEVVFPAAAHLSLACEALLQTSDNSGLKVESVTFRNVAIKLALIVPETDNGIDIQLHLNKTDGKWFSFSVESLSEGEWRMHCQGLIAANHRADNLASGSKSPVDTSKLTQRVTGKRWYDAFHRVGFEYGPSFQPLASIHSDSRYHQAAADIAISTKSELILGESRYLLHPSTIDGCLQLIIIALNSGLHAEMQNGAVPIEIEEMSLWPVTADVDNTLGHSEAWISELSGRYGSSHARLETETGRLLMDISNLRLVAYEAAVPQNARTQRQREPYMQTLWKPDIDLLSSQSALQLFSVSKSERDALSAIVELEQHKRATNSVMFIGQWEVEAISAVTNRISKDTPILLADPSPAHLEVVISNPNIPKNVSAFVFDVETLKAELELANPQDLVLIGGINFEEQSLRETFVEVIKPRVSERGKTIFSVPHLLDTQLDKFISDSGLADPVLRVDLANSSVSCYSVTGSQSDASHTNGYTNGSTNGHFKGLSNGNSNGLSNGQANGHTNGHVNGNGSSHLNGHTNGDVHDGQRITIYTNDDPSATKGSFWAVIAENSKFQVNLRTTEDASAEISTSDRLIIDGKAWNLCEIGQGRFTTLKHLVTSGAPVLWLTTGVQEGKNTAEGSTAGFLRSIRSEDASAKIMLLDIHSSESVTAVQDAVLTLLDRIDTKESGSDTEYWLRDGTLHVPRVVPNTSLNDAYDASIGSVKELPIPKNTPLQGTIEQGELVFQQVAQTPVTEGEVVLQVECASFEVSDVQAQQTTAPRVLVGSLMAVESGLDESLQGEKMVAFSPNPFITSFKTTLDLATLCSGTSPETLAATLPGLTNAMNAIKYAAGVKAKDHVLLLPAPNIFTRAVVALSQSWGFRLTRVVAEGVSQHLGGSASIPASDIDSIMALLNDTENAPNAVVSHDFAALSSEVWRHLPANARFVLNDAVVDGSLDSLPFSRGATFQTTSLKSLQKQQPHQLGGLLREAVEFIKQYKAFETPEVYAIDDLWGADSAIRGKNRNLVVKFDHERSLIKIRPTTDDLQFRPDAAYLLVGGLGGLGRSLTRFMYDRGARDFVFLSRSGADKADAAVHLLDAGAKVRVYRGDVCVKSDVEHLVADVTSTRPICGVIHAAMVLQDVMFDSMTFKQWQRTMAPKVLGAQNLVEALDGNADLDFFVMTSSISATMGNPGQANYSAANSFLDALAYQCRLAGKPATSLILPMILDVGVVSENEAIETALLRKAMYGIDEREMLRGFETAMRNRTWKPSGDSPGASQLILGLEPAALAMAIKQSGAGKEDAYWYHDARFSGLRATVNLLLQDGAGSTSSNGDFKAVLHAARAQGEDAVLTAIANHIIAKLSSMLLIPTEAFELDGTSIAAYGLDSMIGADLRNWLFKQFGLETSFQHLLAPKMTIRTLSTTVAEFLEPTGA
ncbi:polyketide synthase [Fusarium beomiforme]|uniref:Polyketide synthase n=1 Tax=Fusarium beomiforme TaxID=44412 RepID=A0A9P5DQX4_9HYPO|nr:polyketide synthase [Fusarium beomiforme]